MVFPAGLPSHLLMRLHSAVTGGPACWGEGSEQTALPPGNWCEETENRRGQSGGGVEEAAGLDRLQQEDPGEPGRPAAQPDKASSPSGLTVPRPAR